MREHDQILLDRQRDVEIVELWHDAHHGARLLRVVGQPEAQHLELALVADDLRGERLHRRRLAGAVRAEQADALANGHVEVEAVNSGDRTEPLDQPAKPDRGIHGSRLCGFGVRDLVGRLAALGAVLLRGRLVREQHGQRDDDRRQRRARRRSRTPGGSRSSAPAPSTRRPRSGRRCARRRPWPARPARARRPPAPSCSRGPRRARPGSARRPTSPGSSGRGTPCRRRSRAAASTGRTCSTQLPPTGARVKSASAPRIRTSPGISVRRAPKRLIEPVRVARGHEAHRDRGGQEREADLERVVAENPLAGTACPGRTWRTCPRC